MDFGASDRKKICFVNGPHRCCYCLDSGTSIHTVLLQYRISSPWLNTASSKSGLESPSISSTQVVSDMMNQI